MLYLVFLSLDDSSDSHEMTVRFCFYICLRFAVAIAFYEKGTNNNDIHMTMWYSTNFHKIQINLMTLSANDLWHCHWPNPTHTYYNTHTTHTMTTFNLLNLFAQPVWIDWHLQYLIFAFLKFSFSCWFPKKQILHKI